MWPPSISGAQASPATKAVGELDPEPTNLLMKQGQQFAATGDLITARIAFRRAAQVGYAAAALEMGATYDPIVLAELRVRGIASDVNKARSWYEKAKAFGSPEAARRLELLKTIDAP
jgi:TPR repeat protein